MRLRNKKTGDVKEVIVGGYPVSGLTRILECSEMDSNSPFGYKVLGTYASLSDLVSDWEDCDGEFEEFKK